MMQKFVCAVALADGCAFLTVYLNAVMRKAFDRHGALARGFLSFVFVRAFRIENCVIYIFIVAAFLLFIEAND